MRLWLKEYRIKACLSQKEVSTKASITHQYYNYIENGKRTPSTRVAKRIASILNFHWTLFFE